ncbi:TetR/AcrR family transcriptional regulator [Streptomyces sp. NPDC057062]|uniref:TetR/AcrR family transcriptional regulator n=1 Tax=Streptomyces sp. NPDC057062 TaxID=3346011 RepID=UPI0036267082
MTIESATYHQRVALEKRVAIIEAATGLFFESGYDGTSLARIAEAAGVSKATLFKQFPTKAALFGAIVTESWKVGSDDGAAPLPGDIRAGLTAIGGRYVDLLTRPGMASLFRIVIAEAPRFPELAKIQFEHGKMPFFDTVEQYLEAEAAAGHVRLKDSTTAATQFLGMISNHVFWPRLLLVDWNPDGIDTDWVVAEAVETMLARYGVSGTEG